MEVNRVSTKNVTIKPKTKIIRQEVPVTKVVKQRILPSNIVEIKAPDIVKQQIINKEIIDELTNKEIEKRIKESHALDNIITKEEYIYLLQLLKAQRKTKKVVVNDDQSALRRLREMYESVR